MMEEKDFMAQILKINEKVNIDEEFPDWKRSVQFNVKIREKESSFYFVVDGKKVVEVERGKLARADVIIEGNQETMSNLFEGKLALIGAFITKQLTITGAIGDALGAKVLVQAARMF